MFGDVDMTKNRQSLNLPEMVQAIDENQNKSLKEANDVFREIQQTFENYDQKIEKWLGKCEYEYLTAYNIYIKQKEGELFELV